VTIKCGSETLINSGLKQRTYRTLKVNGRLAADMKKGDTFKGKINFIGTVGSTMIFSDMICFS
jgi:hypothetical protein